MAHELPAGTGIRRHLEDYYLDTFGQNKDVLLKYLGQPVILKNKVSGLSLKGGILGSNEYWIYPDCYFIFNKDGQLIATGDTYNNAQ